MISSHDIYYYLFLIFPNSDTQVWELRDAGVESPQQINEVFPDLPNGDIDAAFYCPGSRRTYFFMVRIHLLNG